MPAKSPANAPKINRTAVISISRTVSGMAGGVPD
jgi:hypothetical protein